MDSNRKQEGEKVLGWRQIRIWTPESPPAFSSRDSPDHSPMWGICPHKAQLIHPEQNWAPQIQSNRKTKNKREATLSPFPASIFLFMILIKNCIKVKYLPLGFFSGTFSHSEFSHGSSFLGSQAFLCFRPLGQGSPFDFTLSPKGHLTPLVLIFKYLSLTSMT
jgi:hypothetical protein